MDSLDDSYLLTGYEPTDYFLTETYVVSFTESMTEQRFPEQRFLEDVDYDDAAIGEMLFNAYREQVYHSQREGACLLVSRRRPCPIDRGNPLWKEVKSSTPNMHRLGLLWTDRGSKSSTTVRRRSGDTNSRLFMTEEVYKIKWNDRIATRRISSRSSTRTSSTRSTTSSWTVIEAKLGITWSSWEKSQRNGRIEEVSEFHLRHYCKKKISRGSGYDSGTYW